MLRPAEPFRLICGIGCRDGAIGPSQPALRRLIVRHIPGRRHRQYAALAFDHDISCIGGRRRDEGDASAALTNLDPHEFGATTRLAEAAAGEQEPCSPIAGWRQLIVAGPPFPIVIEFFELFLAIAPQNLVPLRFRRYRQLRDA